MQKAKSHFNPCEWRGVIFLCGFESIEAFSPTTDSFIPFLLSIPKEKTEGWCVYVDNDQLVVLSYKHMLRFGVGEGGQPVQVADLPCPQALKTQDSQPVVDLSRRVIYIVQKGNCLGFSMDTGEEVA